MNFISIFLFFLLNIISCGNNDEETEESINEDISGLKKVNLLHSGVERSYLIYIPTSYDKSVMMPIMFNFHGYSMSAENQLQFTGFDELAEKENFILIVPQGSLLDGYSHWNAGLEGESNKSSADDFSFILNILDEVENTYNVDTSKVYASGYSNGAFFSYALACYYSEKFTAIASVSGTMMEETYNECKPQRSIPLIIFHGTEDYVVPYQGSSAGLISIEGTVKFWKDKNSISSEAIRTSLFSGNMPIEKFSYVDDESLSTIALYKVVGGSHLWFDLTLNDKSTNEIIWDFLKLHKI
ncbi:MAG: hypothetical protein CMP11_08810 [Zetaproteobacteria bacterium]|nr:hypothetical protein [Pseudobdellovibrionaceae bacterium]|tara:strand:- start:699 stop:1592 length:894 start_codon:yes stop_codon:yes gene_type:complete